MKYVVFFAFGAIVSGVACLAAFGPALDSRPTQKAVVVEFVARYCQPDPPAGISPDFYMGEAAALSRVAIGAGVNNLAFAEAMRCRLLGKVK